MANEKSKHEPQDSAYPMGTAQNAGIRNAIPIPETNIAFSPQGHHHDGKHSAPISPLSLLGVNETVTAQNLNALTSGMRSSATSLHYHQNIPLQQRTFRVPFPLLDMPKWPSDTAWKPLSFQRIEQIFLSSDDKGAGGIAYVTVPVGARLTRLTVRVNAPSIGQEFIQVKLIAVNSFGTRELASLSVEHGGESVKAITEQHLVEDDESLAVIAVCIAPPADVVNITEISVGYEIDRLF
jgi:hypothetical protein